MILILIEKSASLNAMKILPTSESKKPGQITVVYHYCQLSRFFFDLDVTSHVCVLGYISKCGSACVREKIGRALLPDLKSVN